MPTDLERMSVFRRDVPAAFLRDVVRALGDVYQEAYDKTEDLPPQYQRYLRPHLLRTLAEIALSTIACRHGLSALDQRNRSGDAHVKIVSGNFVLTLSKIQDPRTPPRWALFRLNYARLSNFWLPSPFFAKEPSPLLIPKDDPRLYIVLGHGPSDGNPRLLGFVHANFVAPSGRSYVGAGINLIREFAIPADHKVETTQEPAVHPQIQEQAKDGDA